jgi:hypothetical protein
MFVPDPIFSPIPDPDPHFFLIWIRFPDPGSRGLKALDPGYGSATLQPVMVKDIVIPVIGNRLSGTSFVYKKKCIQVRSDKMLLTFHASDSFFAPVQIHFLIFCCTACHLYRYLHLRWIPIGLEF